MTYTEFSSYLFFFWSFMVLITAADGIGMGILLMRDRNFLKMYTYISGDKLPIVFGKVLSQCFFLLVNIVLFTVISGMLYSQPVGSLLLTAFLILVVCTIPIYLLFLITSSLRIKSNGIGPVLTILVLVLVNFSNVRMDTNSILDLIVYLNPAFVLTHISEVIHHSLLGTTYEIIWLTFLSLALYCIIGFFGYRKLDIITREGR